MLKLSWLGMEVFAELEDGTIIPLPLPLTQSVTFPGKAHITGKMNEKQRVFKKGSALTLSPNELGEICWFIQNSAKEICKSFVDYSKSVGIPIRYGDSGTVSTKS